MAKIFKTKSVTIDKNLLKHMLYGEEVKRVIGTQQYFVTSYGRVFSGMKAIEYRTINGDIWYCTVWKELKPRLCNGYLSVNINCKREYIHKLVYEAFRNKVDTKVLKIVHKDGNKINNDLTNLGLQWRSKKDYQGHLEYVHQKVKRENILKCLKTY